MASIEVGGNRGGRRAVDSSIPLVPFIDLLLCCVMFLLVTAVWNQLASLQAQAQGQGGTVDALSDNALQLSVRITAAGYELATGAGDQVTLPSHDGALDRAALASRMTQLRPGYPEDTTVTLIADDGVPIQDVTDTMDTLVGTGFPGIVIGNSKM